MVYWDTVVTTIMVQRGSKQIGLECVADTIDEIRETAHVREFATKHRVTKRYNCKVQIGEMHKGNLVLKEIVLPAQ